MFGFKRAEGGGRDLGALLQVSGFRWAGEVFRFRLAGEVSGFR